MKKAEVLTSTFFRSFLLEFLNKIIRSGRRIPITLKYTRGGWIMQKILLITKMTKLPKYTFSYDKGKEDWKLENDKTDKVIERFDTKQDGTEGGVLRKVLGNEGGSVKIKLMSGTYEEERTFPKSRDPVSSKG